MLRIQATQVYHDPLRAGINDVQELSKTHEAIARAKTEIQHRVLTHYLPLYFPEIDRLRGNSRSDWFFAFLHAFPTPASITALTKEEFVTGAWDVVGRKVSKTQILTDIETARSSIGLPLPLEGADQPDAASVATRPEGRTCRTRCEGLARHGMALPAVRGFAVQKKRCSPLNRFAPTSRGDGNAGAPGKRVSIRNGWCLSAKPGSRPTWLRCGAGDRAANPCAALPHTATGAR